MKLLTGCLVLAFLVASTDADAWPWSKSRNPRLPKALDYPVVRPKAKNTQKDTRQKHAKKYLEGTWGQEWDRTLTVKQPKEGNHSLFKD